MFRVRASLPMNSQYDPQAMIGPASAVATPMSVQYASSHPSYSDAVVHIDVLDANDHAPNFLSHKLEAQITEEDGRHLPRVMLKVREKTADICPVMLNVREKTTDICLVMLKVREKTADICPVMLKVREKTADICLVMLKVSEKTADIYLVMLKVTKNSRNLLFLSFVHRLN